MKLGAIVILLALSIPAWGHNPNVIMERETAGNVIWYYLVLGIEHIIPLGLDHILFIIALSLLNSDVKKIILQATAFTVAHSITLALSMKDIIILPSEIIEPIIAFSIFLLALENIFFNKVKVWRLLIIFLFGLIHGLGFAAALNEIGLPRNRFFTSIVSFNLGVEIGQFVIILMVYFLLIRPFGKKKEYRKWVIYPISILIAMVALYWTIERVVG